MTLGVIAASTKTIRFGPLVSPSGFRNPALLARMACTLDSFTSGRLVLGVGIGWFRKEYEAHGYEFPKFRMRKDQFIETLKIIRPLTKGLSVDFHGKYYAANTTCHPKPKEKIHIIIGSRNQEGVEIAATYADEWNDYESTPDHFRTLKRQLDHKKTNSIEVSRMGPIIIGDNKTDLELRVAQYSKLTGSPRDAQKLVKMGVLCGRPDEFVAQLNGFIEAGVQKFYFQILDSKDRDMIDLLTDTLRNRM